MKLSLVPYIVCANSEGCSKTMRMHRLTWAFAVHPCDVTFSHGLACLCWYCIMSQLMTKPTKWLFSQRRLRSESSLCAQWVAKDYAFFMCLWTAKTLIRLGGCSGYLSLRWAHMPFCWFCHEAAQIIKVFHSCHFIWHIPKISSSEVHIEGLSPWSWSKHTFLNP